MLVEPWLHIAAHISLLIVVGILLAAVAGSLLFPERVKK
jgi:hypothetical protein